jgi:hypothetical protein
MAGQSKAYGEHVIWCEVPKALGLRRMTRIHRDVRPIVMTMLVVFAGDEDAHAA